MQPFNTASVVSGQGGFQKIEGDWICKRGLLNNSR